MRDLGIGSWPARRVRMAPGSVALIQGERRLTYVELAERVEGFARALRALGVRRGDRVAYLGPNDIATFETLFAATHLGAIFVPLNTRLAADEIAYMLRDSGAKVLVHGPEHAQLVADAKPLDHGVDHVLPAHVDPAAIGADATPVDGPVALSDPALILYTSGTTGRPKGAVLTHANLVWNTINQLAHFDLASTDVSLCVAPLFHVTGLGQVTLPTFFKGGTVVVAPKFDPEWLLSNVGPLRITGFSAVPTMLQMLCDHPLWDARARPAAAAGLRHDRDGAGRVHGAAGRLGRAPRVGGGAALLHRGRAAHAGRGRGADNPGRHSGTAGARSARVCRLLAAPGRH